MSRTVAAPEKRESLYSLVDTLQAIVQTIEGAEDAEQIAALREMYDEQLVAIVKKVDSFVAYLNRADAERSYLKNERADIDHRIDRIDSQAEYLYQTAKRVMDMAGVRKLEGAVHSLSLRKCPDSVDINAEYLVPTKYISIQVTSVADKTAIKKDLQSGIEVPGASLRRGGDTLVAK